MVDRLSKQEMMYLARYIVAKRPNLSEAMRENILTGAIDESLGLLVEAMEIIQDRLASISTDT